MVKKAVVLSSGGLDSTTCMGIAKAEGYEIYSLSFDYGQRHKKELECAKEVADFFGAKEHLIIDFNLRAWGGSALTEDIDVPEDRGLHEMVKEIPITYVPGRNVIFLAFAASYAEKIGASAIFTGVNSIDFSGYPDCRKEFIDAFQNTINVGTKAGLKEETRVIITAPLQFMNKKEIVQAGLKNGVDYSLTSSCYNGREKACGVCDSCKLRIQGFREAGTKDPIEYEIDVDWDL